MHGVGAAWLITSLSPSAAVVALLQSATALPSFLLALPAGALADVVDRRKMLLIAQTMMMFAAGALALITLFGTVNTTVLLALTVMLSVGGTLNMPSWIATTPELVGRENLMAASSLNSVSMNVAGALGPAVAGVLIATAGPGWVFLVNAVTFVGVVGVIVRWKRTPTMSSLPPEHVAAAIRTGFRYVRNDVNMTVLMARLAGVMLFATANGALMPVLARQRVGVTAGQFGALSTAAGIGAVVTALALPRIRRNVGPDVIAGVGSGALALALVGLGTTTALVPFAAALVVAGAAQIAVFSSIFSIVQAVLPNWVRGRGLALAMLVVQGVTVVASIGWGALLSARGASSTMLIAGIGLGVVTVAMLPLRLSGRAEIDLGSSESAWPHPHTALEVDGERGPVLVTVTYPVRPEAVEDFRTAMHAVGRQRRRNGAMSWALYEVAHHPGHFMETFALATWTEHEREQHRRTNADAEVHRQARQHLVDGSEPMAEHFLGVRRAHRPRPVLPHLGRHHESADVEVAVEIGDGDHLQRSSSSPGHRHTDDHGLAQSVDDQSAS
jgi:MFS family permease